MEDTIFQAHSSFTSTIYLALATMVVCGGVAWYLYFGKNINANKRMRQIGAMLLFYGVLISAGVAIFSFWQKTKTIDLVFKQDGVETPYGYLQYNQIHQANIKTEAITTPLNANRVRSRVNLLIITEINNKTHVLSEEDYPIRDILGEIQKRRKK